MKMALVKLKETSSTNTWCREHIRDVDMPVFVMTEAQTAGRGQRGNSWEAEAGKNLTFSIVWRPEGVSPAEQFAISEAVALGVKDYLGSRGIEARVKWPNDIYAGDRKICGILIEHSILGCRIDRSIIGVGVNVNQSVFVSDAPNPVSMTNISGKRYDLETEADEISEYISVRLDDATSENGRRVLHEDFMSGLWRGDGGWYPFRDVEEGRFFTGRIEGVAPTGHLAVRERDSDKIRSYAFKEVEFILG
ncbi:MAG: biotin--[acetyl-CoA-carboxylase] ligase [Muribaculaceae bacterium]|nr:biotin--[acetyl-CoA-carboxylase] ligase [Muribaculaceae bacterium]